MIAALRTRVATTYVVQCTLSSQKNLGKCADPVAQPQNGNNSLRVVKSLDSQQRISDVRRALEIHVGKRYLTTGTALL